MSSNDLSDALDMIYRNNHKEKRTRKKSKQEFIFSEEITERDAIRVPAKQKCEKNDVQAVEEKNNTVKLVSQAKYYSVGCSINIGKRKYQQDSIAVSNNNYTNPCSSNKVFAVLSDGMGGLNGGEQASALCTKRMLESYAQWNTILDYPSFFKRNLDVVDNEIYMLKDAENNPLGAGATIICCAIDNNKLFWASVGDSHLYLINKFGIKRLNVEHNYMLQLMQMVSNGEITAEAANQNSQKDALISYMGIGGLPMVDLNTEVVDFDKDDIVLMCSDGLYRALSDSEIYSVVNDNKADMPLLANILVNQALDKQYKYQDNVSVILIKSIN